MSISCWLVTVELFMDASRNETIRVKANTEQKARILAQLAFKKKYGTNSIIIKSVKRLEQNI